MNFPLFYERDSGKETMNAPLLEIQPRKVKFIFEVKKQSSCAVQLANISKHYIAFKVKTTSPKKYCVRPNTGIIKPNSICDFTVVMLAQRSAPCDLQCKDKFLIQSTIVPFGSTEDDISPGMFSKDSSKHIQERKLKVMLISPPPSPPVLLPLNRVTKQELSQETSVQKEKLPRGIENFRPPVFFRAADDTKVKGFESRWIEDVKLSPVEDVNLGNSIEEQKSKLTAMESKLDEAGFTIRRLTEERSTDIQEKEKLKQELETLRRTSGARKVQETLRRTSGARKVQVGFPFLYVCMVALIGLTAGYTLHL